MTAYQGGKQKLGKQIATIIKEVEKKLGYNNLPYLEPFCGMCGVMKHFSIDPERVCEATDLNPDIISMWRAIQKGWEPPSECTEEYYNELKESTEPSPERGFLGSVASYGCIFFKSFRHIYNRDYIKEGAIAIRNVRDALQSVTFMDSQSYVNTTRYNYLIYCDPPYRNNGYSNSTKYFKFDHDVFWITMREWSRDNIVIISEHTAPDDFVCIWTKPTTLTINCKNVDKVEKLFLFRDYKL